MKRFICMIFHSEFWLLLSNDNGVRQMRCTKCHREWSENE
jgi:hypothetical protein